MATRNITALLTDQGAGNLSYPNAGEWYANVGDQINVTVADITGGSALSTWGEVENDSQGGGRIDAASGSSQSGTSSSQFLSAAIPGSAHTGSDAVMHFFSPTGGGATYSGRLYINVPNPINGVPTHNNAASPNVTVTLSITNPAATPTSGSTVLMTATQTEIDDGSPTWNETQPHATTFTQARGTSQTYYTGIWTNRSGSNEIFVGVAAAGDNPSSLGAYGYGRTVAVDYLNTPTSVSLSYSSISVAASTAYTMPTVSSYDANVVYYLTTVGGSGYTAGSNHSGIFTGYIGRTHSSSQFKTDDGSSTNATSASSAGTTTYYVWTKRATSTGGTGLYHYSGTGFTLTTTAGSTTPTVTVVDEGTINYFYITDANALIKHYVRLSNTLSNYSYKVSASTSAEESLSSWTAGNGGTIALYVAAGTTNQSSSALQGTDGTGQIFYVWRKKTDGSDTPAVVVNSGTNLSYKRKFIDISSVNEIQDTNINTASNATTQAVGVSIVSSIGWLYKLVDSGSDASAIVTSTSTNPLTLTAGSNYMPGTTAGNTKTLDLYIKSPAGGTAYYGPKDQVVLTRGAVPGSWEDTVANAGYGFAIYNTNGAVMLNTNSSIQRYIAQGTTTIYTSGGSAWSLSAGVYTSALISGGGLNLAGVSYSIMAWHASEPGSTLTQVWTEKRNSSGGTSGTLSHFVIHTRMTSGNVEWVIYKT